MTAKLGNAKILSMLKELHGDSYDFSRVHTDKRHDVVEISCPTHGWITTNLGNLLRGQKGCKKCRGSNISLGKRLVETDFLTRISLRNSAGYAFKNTKYVNMTTDVEIECLVHGAFKALPLNLLREDRAHLCNKCEAGTHMSAPERGLLEWCQSLGVSVESGNRSVIAPKEIDIWFPDHKFGVELHGLYWHRGVDRGCQTKYNMAKSVGVRLIQVYEDEWAFKADVVKDMIKAKLGLRSTLYARKTNLQSITPSVANEFYDKWHIAGGARGSEHSGLFHAGVLVAALTVAKSRYSAHDLEIVRYAASCNLVSGFAKLFADVCARHAGKSVISYADLRLTTGDQYIKAEFTDAGITVPDYYWVKRLTKLPRYRTQKHLLKTNLLFKDFYALEKSESEICTEAGYHKVYGVGHRKLVKIIRPALD